MVNLRGWFVCRQRAQTGPCREGLDRLLVSPNGREGQHYIIGSQNISEQTEERVAECEISFQN